MNNIFYMFIITIFALSFNACGYKAPPYYEETPTEDENIKFILKKKSFDNLENNTSCE